MNDDDDLRALSRRELLRSALVGGGGLLLGIGCGSTRAYADADARARVSPPEQCAATDDNIEGPYYRPGAPFRSDLVTGGVRGTPLVLAGRVLAPDCRTPLRHAVLDVWQADAEGHYDNDAAMEHIAREVFRLRGRLRTDARGRYELRTILPGHYLNGPTYRPAHIHVKVGARGHALLTTQLYFDRDPYNEADAFFLPSLVLDMHEAQRGKRARFDFVLA